MPPTINHTERAHAPFSPSASDRWLACPASVRLSEGVADSGQTEYTVAGTLMHEHSEVYLRNWEDPSKGTAILKGEYPMQGKKKGAVILSPKQWQEHVVPYVLAVREVFEGYALMDKEPILLVEEKVDIEGKDCYGTLDAAVVVPDQYVELFDLKCGQGHIVEAAAPQFKSYLLGLADKYMGKEARKKALYTVHICQAADSDRPHKKFTYAYSDLLEHKKAIKAAISQAKDAEPGPIGDHCHWCPALANCPAQWKHAMSVLEDDPTQDITLLPAHLLTLDQKAMVLKNAGVVRKWLDAVEAECLRAALEDNQEIPDWKLVRGRANRQWDPEKTEDDIAEELELLDIDPWKKKLVSFTEVEKQVKTFGGSVDHLVVKPEGKIVLAPVTDKRPPVDRLAVLDD